MVHTSTPPPGFYNSHIPERSKIRFVNALFFFVTEVDMRFFLTRLEEIGEFGEYFCDSTMEGNSRHI